MQSGNIKNIQNLQYEIQGPHSNKYFSLMSHGICQQIVW